MAQKTPLPPPTIALSADLRHLSEEGRGDTLRATRNLFLVNAGLTGLLLQVALLSPIAVAIPAAVCFSLGLGLGWFLAIRYLELRKPMVKSSVLGR